MSMMTIWRGSTASPTTLDDAVLYAPRTNSITQTRGTGSPTFTRATTETGQKWDEAGYLDFTALAGEIVFKGARRERNWIQAPTENWASAGWAKSGISVSGNRLTATGANGVIYDNAALGMGTDRTAVGSVTLSRVTGTGNIDVSTNGGTTWTTVSVTGARVSVSLTGNINGQFAIRIVTSGDAVDATYPQLEDVTGQTTQMASEYVSVGAPNDWAGPELVTNGTFDTATTGWAAVNSTLSVVSGKLRVTNVGANAGYCHQAITTVVGQKYVLSASVTQQTSSTYSIYIGNGPGSGALGGLGTAASVEFTATATTTYLSPINTQAVDGRYTDFDNISVKPAAYHGSMVDGVKCYGTDRSGNPITQTTTYDAVTLNGVAGTYVSTPDSVAASITGDIDIRMYLSVADLTATQFLLNKLYASYAYDVYLDASNIVARFSLNGSTTTNASSSVAITTAATNNNAFWLRVTRVASTGVVIFYTSNNGSDWTQLGTDQATTAGNIFDGSDVINIGAQNGAITFSGKIYAAQIYNGIDGTLAVDFDASRYAGGTTLTGSTGETWTLNGSAVIHPTNYPIVGYVPWEARTNLCLQSQTFDNASWTWNAATISANAAVAPDGTTTADKLVETATNDWHVVYQAGFALAANTHSVYAKAAERSVLQITIVGGTDTANFDLQNGVVGTVSAGTSRIEPAGNGWYRCYFTPASTSSSIQLSVQTSTSAARQAAYAGDITKGIYIYGAQVELGSFATPYQPTTTVAVARNADVEAVTTSGAILAVGGTISLTYIPYHSPVGTIALWGTYVDASNYTAILHDATNLIFRKRIAGVNYDATIANAFTSGTTYKMAASWGVGGSTIYLNGVAGTPHANTTAAQIAATMQFGADGNSLQQPGAAVIKNYIWQRQLSGSEQAAITA